MLGPHAVSARPSSTPASPGERTPIGRSPGATWRPGNEPWARTRRLSRLRVAGSTRPVPARPDRRKSTVEPRCGSGWAVPAGLVGWSEPGTQAQGGDSW
jgi:hypothetical protein